jgi:hypothetical protein
LSLRPDDAPGKTFIVLPGPAVLFRGTIIVVTDHGPAQCTGLRRALKKTSQLAVQKDAIARRKKNSGLKRILLYVKT